MVFRTRKITILAGLLFAVFLAKGQAPVFTDASKWKVTDGNSSWVATALQMKTYIGAGTGTVTSFSAGNLSPLFTSSVATATTTPALSFALSNAGANTYFGNATGGATAPSFTSAGALTKTDDTNVTLTLGGTPTSALLQSASLTLGWTGNLAVSRGGIGVGTITGLMQGNGTGAVTGITNSSTTGQVLRVVGASSYSWGAVDLQSANAVTGVLPFANGGEKVTWGRATAQTALNSNILTVTVGGSDETYIVSMNILVTTSSAENFTASVTYTDEGNTSRVMTMYFNALASQTSSVRGAGFGAAPYGGFPVQIRCKASTNIVFKTDSGTYGCTYNVEAICKRVQ